MQLTEGSRLGPYEVIEPIGAGGMGEVYRARDVRLGREVAVKVLPSDVSRDPERLIRFEREARSASALNHPNIVTILDFTSADGEAWLVMELVRGKSLRDVLSGGALPLKRLLPIAAGIADGLAAAHAAGIVHRDLKPENIMTADGGAAKILDFGLVKQMPGTDPNAPTEVNVTRAGTIVGTVSYMSPEQARGEEVDFRTDQFSLGLILHEAVTGIHPFRRGTVMDTLAAVLNDEHQPLHGLPEPFVWIVERCLAKNPADRYGSTRDLAHDLERLRHSSGIAMGVSRTSSPARRPLAKWALLVAALAAVAALGLLAMLAPWKRSSTGISEPIQAALPTPEIAEVILEEVGQTVALSPDGRRLAIYGADGTGTTGLWVRDLRTGSTQRLAERAFSVGWSSDGRNVAYFADGKLMTVSADGGPPQVVCLARPESTPTWHGDTILYAQYSIEPGIFSVRASGGTPRLVVAPTTPTNLPWWPQFLPDGRHFLYLRFHPGASGEVDHELYFASLDGKTNTRVAEMDSLAAYANGHLLFVRGGSLLAQPFDPDTGHLSGEAQRVVDGVHYFGNTGTAAFSVSQNGILAWRVARRPVRLAWFARNGLEGETIATALMLPDGRLSPDGQRYAVGVLDPQRGSSDLWIYDLQRKSGERLSHKSLDEHEPVWGHDGRTIYYRSDGNKGPPDIFRWILGEGTGAVFHQGVAVEEPRDVSRDGRWLLFTQARQFGNEMHILPLMPPGPPRPVTSTPFNESSPRFSPDARWIAYASDASGSPEVYVRPVGTSSASPVRVSRQGGSLPRWRSDGRELYFLAPGGKVMSVAVGADGTPGAPEMLFTATSAVDFDPAPDGSRVLVQLAEQSSEPVIHLLINWPGRLKPSR
jgi:eukaryotic-like serine/threonine-protein kinase